MRKLTSNWFDQGNSQRLLRVVIPSESCLLKIQKIPPERVVLSNLNFRHVSLEFVNHMNPRSDIAGSDTTPPNSLHPLHTVLRYMLNVYGRAPFIRAHVYGICAP